MPATQATPILRTLDGSADDADRLKRRGFYVDMDVNAQIREPSEISEAEVADQLARARRAVAATSTLLSADIQSRLANPRAEALEFAGAMVEALTEVGYDRTPEAAAEVMVKTLSKVRERSIATVAGDTPDSGSAA